MRVLITGVSGFVGTHLAANLVREGLEVHGIAERETVTLDRKVIFHPCDIRDCENLAVILQEVRPEEIFHLAGVSFLPEAGLELETTFQINLFGTLALYEVIRKMGSRPRILFVGSAQEYGLSFNDTRPVTEACPLRPIDHYSTSKAAADLLSIQYCYSSNLPIIRVRPFNHTGPGQSDQFVCSGLAKQIAEIEVERREPVLYVGNLEAKRDFLDVRDVVLAYRLALRQGKVGEVYNICSGRSVSIKEIMNFLIVLSRKTIRVVEDPLRRREVEVAEMLGDCQKFKALTGWQSVIPLEQTLEDLLDHWRKVVSS